MNWHPAWDGQKTIIVKKERRLILQYHLSSTGLGNFSSGSVIDSEARFAFPFLHSITIISSVILGLFIYQAMITKTLRTRCLNAMVQSSPVMAPACRGIADSHTPAYPRVPVLRTSNIPFLFIAKMAHAQHLAGGWEGERGRKGRKLPGEVLQCFKSLSSQSAEHSGMNNRFGSWPACTRESVTAALWSGLAAFDGCAVSPNSWRRSAPAAPETDGRKQQTKSKSRGFFVRQTQVLGSARARRVPSSVACGALRWEEQALLCQHSLPKAAPGRRCHTTPRGWPSTAPSQGVRHLLKLLTALLQWRPPPVALPVWMSRWEAPQAHHSVLPSAHQCPFCIPKVDWMCPGQLFITPWDACVSFWGIWGWKDWSACLISCTLP